MLLAVCSLKGSPGVTTTTVGLAARWPAPQIPVVIECDPAGGDLLARFRLDQRLGLVSLVAAARSGAAPDEALRQHSQILPGGLRVVAGPAGAEQAHVAVTEIARTDPSPLRAAGNYPGLVVLADCGRVSPESPALPIIQTADAMLLLAHARDDALAHLAARLPALRSWSIRPWLVLVGDGYSTAEVSLALGVPIKGRLPHDPKGAAFLSGQPRPWDVKSAIGRECARVARLIALNVRPSLQPDADAQALVPSAIHQPGQEARG